MNIERQYIGARYVPQFMGTYSATTAYDNLSVVDDGFGTSYISKIPVPPNVPLTNTEYWALYGASSGAILDLQGRMNTAESDITAIKSSILSIGGQVEDNTVDIAQIKLDIDDLEDIAEKHVSAKVIVVNEATTFSALNALLTTPCWIVLEADVTISNTNSTFNDNLIGVIGAGGKFVGGNDFTLRFPNGTIFLNDDRQIFSSQMIVKGTGDTMLVGRARPQWWGYYPGSSTSYGNEFVYATGSFFNEFAFSAGIWHAYPNMTVSHRKVIMEKGAIIDGVLHAGVSGCTDVEYEGRVYATVRVGFTGQCSHINMPDGISIVGINSSYYNQTAEGGCKGVHVSDGSTYINIGDIDIEYTSTRSDSSATYGLGIDQNSSYITIGRYRSSHNNGRTDGTGMDIYCNTCTHITINDIEISNVEKAIHSCIRLTTCNNSRFGNIRILAGSTSTSCIMVDGSSGDIVFEGAIRTYKESPPTTFYAIFLNDNTVHDIAFNGSVVVNGANQALRIVSSLRIALFDVYFYNITGTAIVSTGTYYIAKNWSA